MDEYINRQKLIRDVDNKNLWGMSGTAVIKMIHDAPVDPDVVKVVRCRDCVAHNICKTEYIFKREKVKDPFCCVGKVDE